MPTARPILSRLRHRFAGQPPIETVARERVEIAPAETIDYRPALHLPDEVDRIIACADDLPVADYLRRTAGGAMPAPATTAYRLDDALIVGRAIYPPGAMLSVGDGLRPPLLRSTPPRIGEAVLATNWVCEQYFGHWLTDGLSLELLAGDLGIAPIGVDRPDWTQEAPYRERTGLACPRPARARVERLWWIDDRSINTDRMRRMAALRARLHPRRPDDGGRVFLRRVGGAARRLDNQDEVADLLARRGFAVLTPETTPVADLQAAIAGATLVVSVEGSALCHAIVGMADGGTILALQPPRRVNWIQKVWCDCAALRLAWTVCDPAADEGFVMPLDRLERVIDLIDAAPAL